MAAYRSAAAAHSIRCSGPMSRRRAASPSSPPPIAPSMASSATTSKRRWRISRSRATTMAAAIVTTPEIAKSLGKHDLVTVKALQLAVSNGQEAQHNSWDGSHFATARAAAKRAYHEAGIDKPREQLSLIEAHDCFSVTELVTMEDLFISPEGGAVKDVLDGFFDAEGKVPCQIDGGLKCFGHPIGASGLRMIYEIYLQMQGRAGARQRQEEPVRGLVHNLGGFPH